MAAGCPTRESFMDFLDGRLSEEQLEEVSGHLDSCPDCQGVVDTLDQVHDTLVSELRELRGAAPEPRLPAVCAQALARAELFYEFPPPAESRSEPLKLGWLGKYELLGRLGQGGMGTVYLARQARLDRQVALKVLSPGRVSDKNSLARFESEMKAVGKLEHPNIVRAYDADEAEGVHFLVMEAVSGCDLAQLLKRRVGPLPVAEACDIIRQAANGLHHAHQHGLVHRDIKPSNLILTTAGEVKVLDLGLAVLQPGIRTGDELTEESQLVGTPEYIAPEQAIDSHAIGPRADIYSLGVTFYKLLTGRTPYGEGRRDKPLRMIMAHLNSPLVDIRTLRNDIPAPLADIVRRMLAKDPEKRFATAAEVSQLLAPWAAGSRPAALLEGEPQAAERQPSKTLSFEQPTTDFGDTVERQGKSDQLSAARGAESDAEKIVPLTAPVKIPPWHRRPVMAAAMAAGFLILLSTIWIIVRDRDGREVGRLAVPKGGSAKVVDDGQGTPAKPAERQIGSNDIGQPPRKTADVPRESSGATKQASAELPTSMSRLALVGHPAPLPGVRSWSLETRGHRGPVRAMACSPDGQLVASGGDDGTIRMWEVATGRLVRMLVAHNQPVVSLAFSGDNEFLASGGVTDSPENPVHIWRVATGRHERAYHLNRLEAHNVAWAKEPNRLWVGGSRNELLLLDLMSEEPVRHIDIETSGTRMRLSPDKTLVAVSHMHGDQVLVYELDSAKKIAELKTAAPEARVAWAPDSRRVALTDANGVIELWNVRENKKLKSFREKRGQPRATEISWAPQGDLLAVLEQDQELWDTSSGTKVGDGPDGSNAARGLPAWSPDGRILMQGCEDSHIRLCDVPGYKLVRKIDGHRGVAYPAASHGNAWSTDGRSLAIFTASSDETVSWLRLIDLTTGDTTDSLKATTEIAATWRPQHRELAVTRWADGLGTIVSYGDDLKEPIRTLDLGKISISTLRHSPPQFSPDGTRLAVAVDNVVRVYSVEDEPRLVELRGHDGTNVRFVWSPDGRELASAAFDGTEVRVWNVDEGRLVRKLSGDANLAGIQNLAWSPDGQVISTAGVHTGAFHLFNPNNGEFLKTVANPTGGWGGLWQESSRRFAAFNYGPVCRWLDPSTDTEIRTVRGYVPAFSALSPDRRTMASSEGNALYLWDFETGRRHGTQLWLAKYQPATIGASGHLRVSHPFVQDELLYVVDTGTGQEMLDADQFAAKYGWTNDPDRAVLWQAGR